MELTEVLSSTGAIVPLQDISSQPQAVFRPDPTTPDSLFNAGKEHPEFARDGGRVTYTTFIDSSVYAPT